MRRILSLALCLVAFSVWGDAPLITCNGSGFLQSQANPPKYSCATPSGGGGDTITSPNSTLSVGGTSSATTLDVNLSHANTWAALQAFGNNLSFGGATLAVTSLTTNNLLQYSGTNWINVTPASIGAVTSLTVTGTSGAATFSGGVLNIPQYSGGGGSGTVTAVSSGNLTGLFTVSVTSPTTTPALGFTYSSQIANLVFASPNGSSGSPLFRSLVGADLPTPGASSLGGIESYASVSHQWINAISTSGVPASTQPSFVDISGTASNAQLANPATTVNSQTCTLGSTCTVAAAAGTLTGATLASGVTASSLTSAAGGSFGTAAYVNTGTSGGTVAENNGANTWSALQTFTGAIAQYITGGAVEQAVFSNGNSGTSLSVNCDNGNVQSVTITGAVTIGLTTPTHPCKFTLLITQDATGHVYGLAATILWPAGTAPTLSTTANAKDAATLIYDGSSTWGEGNTAFAVSR